MDANVKSVLYLEDLKPKAITQFWAQESKNFIDPFVYSIKIVSQDSTCELFTYSSFVATRLDVALVLMVRSPDRDYPADIRLVRVSSYECNITCRDRDLT